MSSSSSKDRAFYLKDLHAALPQLDSDGTTKQNHDGGGKNLKLAKGPKISPFLTLPTEIHFLIFDFVINSRVIRVTRTGSNIDAIRSLYETCPRLTREILEWARPQPHLHGCRYFGIMNLHTVTVEYEDLFSPAPYLRSFCLKKWESPLTPSDLQTLGAWRRMLRSCRTKPRKSRGKDVRQSNSNGNLAQGHFNVRDLPYSLRKYDTFSVFQLVARRWAIKRAELRRHDKLFLNADDF